MSINLPHPLPDDMRALASRSLDAAEATLERTADTALEAVRFIDLASAGWKQGATDLQLKALEIAENTPRRACAIGAACSRSARRRNFRNSTMVSLVTSRPSSCASHSSWVTSRCGSPWISRNLSQA
jgi:hypothetical protein